MVARLFKQRINDILAKFNDRVILEACENANFFGLESKGVKQVRGNGVLVLTHNALNFEMWVKPRTIIKIPIVKIKKIESVKSHLHKTKFTKLLKVYFINERGQLDSVAWLVRNLERWIDALKALIPPSN